jgi:diguanylate cyclase (GGDEF)-like protein
MRVSVQAKLLASFGVVVALMLAVGLIGIARLGSDNRHLDRLASKVVPSTRAVGDINALMNKYRKDQLHYIVALPADRPLSAEGSIAGDLAEDLSLMGRSLRAYRSEGLIEDPADGRLLDTFQADFARYVALTAAFAPLADRGHILAAGEAVGNGPGDHEYDKLKAVIAAWNDHEIKTAQAAATASRSSYDLSVVLILGLLGAAVAIALAVAVVMTDSLRRLAGENEALLEASRVEANTDALTSLPNRRALMRDLERELDEASEQRPLILALFDLNGFKQYNDTFGHLAGDALLVRVGDRVRRALEDSATAYRMGGDEFCVLAATDASGGAVIARRAATALSEKGEAFTIDCCYGVANLPREASAASDALRLADQRMYEGKAGRVSASRQSTDVLLELLSEHSPGLREHIGEVAQLATMVAHSLGLSESEVERIELAAELHDVGKVALPETILNKPGALDDDEWSFMQRHTEIGERIINAAPSLAHAAELVRAHHENYDGSGYPDRLAGEEIPIGARIIAVCDAFAAMIKKRPYSDAIEVADALAEVRGCAGSRFDPRIAKLFCELIEDPGHGAGSQMQSESASYAAVS